METIYFKRIDAGIMTIDQVPPMWYEKVVELINAKQSVDK